MAILSVLVSLLLPAVQQSRESARRAACRNNLRQLGLAMQNHEATFGRFPSNGWGFDWVGEPDRGTDRHQPGGWIFNLLPQLEQSAIRDLAADATGAQRRRLLGEMMRTPLALTKCPSRPGEQLSPSNPGVIPRNADWTANVAKTDYAVKDPLSRPARRFINDVSAG
jgi:type II secretory pathway pseudopilin PulG